MEVRKTKFTDLVDSLLSQIERLDDPRIVEIISNDHPSISVGKKRNLLMDRAKGEYLCFIDDDDRVWGDYIPLIIKALSGKPDCVGIRVLITFDGGFPEIREFYANNKTNMLGKDGIMHSPPYHLNPIRSSIARSIRFPDKSMQEDSEWSVGIRPKIKTGVIIPDIIYYYDFSETNSLTRRKEVPNPGMQPPAMQEPRLRRRRIWGRDGKLIPHPDEPRA